ncbi:hypothetical protein [Thauera sp.]|uniref:hypothetical protein n=1 Tax=Thauera sp. TaxID=1905334 RepID=UPI0039E67387
MTTITIELPDDIAEQARRQGLLSASAISAMLESALLREKNNLVHGQREQVARAMARLREIGQGASLGMDVRQAIEDGRD